MKNTSLSMTFELLIYHVFFFSYKPIRDRQTDGQTDLLQHVTRFPSENQCCAYTVVRAMNVFNGKDHFRGSSSSETLRPIFKKMARLITSATWPRTQISIVIRCKGTWLRMREFVGIRRLFCTFFVTHKQLGRWHNEMYNKLTSPPRWNR